MSVVIPTYNRAEALRETLEALAQQKLADAWEVLVVANRCTDDTPQMVQSLRADFPTDLRVIPEEIPGASAARNTGLRSASGEVVVFMDDDIILEAGALQRAILDYKSDPAAWFVAQILPLPEHAATPFGQFRTAMLPPTCRHEPVAEVAWFASGIAVVPRTSALAFGGYNEAYSTAALEDADMFVRLRDKGVQIKYDPGLIGIHNDWAGATLKSFCERQRIHCRTAPLLASSFDESDHPWSELIVRNQPVDLSKDSPLTIANKLAKRIVSTPIVHQISVGIAETMQKYNTPPAVLWKVYRVSIAGAMYRGYREGLDQLRV